ncbi:MAG: RnfH family protein, partial [Proteobacteria bacterium]
MADRSIEIEVVYAAVDDQALISLQVPVGTTVTQA